MKRIRVGLSVSEFERAAKEVEKYKKKLYGRQGSLLKDLQKRVLSLLK